MPICKNCSNEFPNYIVADGKRKYLNKRAYCLDCSPGGTHNTKQIHSSPVGKQFVCVDCGKEYIYRAKRDTTERCHTCKVKRHRRTIKQRAVEYLGGRCQNCGYDKCIDALQFHHTDPSIKDADPSRLYDKGWEAVRKEIEKCVLLCANCHIEEHVRLRL